jgi:hypothetical protein
MIMTKVIIAREITVTTSNPMNADVTLAIDPKCNDKGMILEATSTGFIF